MTDATPSATAGTRSPSDSLQLAIESFKQTPRTADIVSRAKAIAKSKHSDEALQLALDSFPDKDVADKVILDRAAAFDKFLDA